ncbi:hypothetical protein [Halorussus marinus]|uniref:hypothetical protein n=1 Tax=Halorussus marinus TaxID=2505976 RepID=UPI00106F0545|nr:hypothetical protein [Halorussus marinus]
MPGPVEGVPDDGGGSGGNVLPTWIFNLKPLVGAVSTLTMIASDPETWVREIVAEWIVGGILDSVQYALGWAFFAIERTTTIVLDGLGPLATPFEIIGNGAVGAINVVYSAAEGVANAAGLAGPPAAAIAVMAVMTVLAVVAYATLKVIPGSDAVEGGLESLR